MKGLFGEVDGGLYGAVSVPRHTTTGLRPVSGGGLDFDTHPAARELPVLQQGRGCVRRLLDLQRRDMGRGDNDRRTTPICHA